MCRYQDKNYKNNWICFRCKRAFKSNNKQSLCPECGIIASCMGHDFKPPRKTNKPQWKKLEILIKNGIYFNSCGCAGPGYKDKYQTLGDVKRSV